MSTLKQICISMDQYVSVWKPSHIYTFEYICLHGSINRTVVGTTRLTILLVVIDNSLLVINDNEFGFQTHDIFRVILD